MIPTPTVLDLAAVRAIWRTDLTDEQLTTYVQAAQVQCEAWAADAADAGAIDRTGPNYLLAVTWQARENNAATTRDGEVVNVDGYAVRVRPLLDAVKTQLRPPRAVPAVG
jgi:hypothetical protein